MVKEEAGGYEHIVDEASETEEKVERSVGNSKENTDHEVVSPEDHVEREVKQVCHPREAPATKILNAGHYVKAFTTDAIVSLWSLIIGWQ